MTESFPLIINVDNQPIELCKLLKIANLVGGGGEAKIVISEGYVYVNQEVEYQKRKKIYDGDIIEFNGECIQVNVTDTGFIQEKAVTKAHKAKTNQTPKKATAKKQQAQSGELNVTKRRPINF